jgi:hypothetical protein
MKYVGVFLDQSTISTLFFSSFSYKYQTCWVLLAIIYGLLTCYSNFSTTYENVHRRLFFYKWLDCIPLQKGFFKLTS